LKSIELDTAIAFVGFGFLLAGIYLWLGLAAAFILLGLVLIVVGWRLEVSTLKRSTNEPDQTDHTERN
jgi:hypothetical protein